MSNLSIRKLIDAIDDMCIEFDIQYLHRNVNYLRMSNKKRRGDVRFVMDDKYVQDLMRGGKEYLPVLLWLPRDKAEQVIDEFTAKYGPPADNPEKQ